MRTKWVLVWSCVFAASLSAQQTPPAGQKAAPQTPPKASQPAASASANPITDSIKGGYAYVKDNLTKAAAQVPEKGYMFKPAGVAAEVRNFGQIIGHVANANYMFCAPLVGEAMQGESGPGGANFEKKTAKAELQKGLADSFAYCDKAFAAVNDHNGGQAVTGLPIGPTTKLGALAFNNMHDGEHYGNVITYMRAMGMVPPSSQQQPPAKGK